MTLIAAGERQAAVALLVRRKGASVALPLWSIQGQPSGNSRPTGEKYCRYNVFTDHKSGAPSQASDSGGLAP